MKAPLIMSVLMTSFGLLLRPATAQTLASHPVAVIELFTSEGCSSCPSADQLLSETVRQAAQKKQPVYALSFHVDYWNRLGWRDPFSSHQFSTRQWQYAKQFGASNVYTPQAVLNGRQEFVGSNRAKLNDLLADALQQPAPVGVDLTASQSARTVTVTYKLTGKLAGTVLRVALVSNQVSSSVVRGENAGRKLTHNNVVRAFETVQASASGRVTLTAPADFDAANGAVIAYVQNEKTLSTLGAGRIILSGI